MNLALHIAKIEVECDRIEQDSHLKNSPDGFVALNDLRMALTKLKLAVQQRNGQKERGQ